MSKVEEFIEKLKELHLDIDKIHRAIPKDNEEQWETYNPASDIVNIFPPALAAGINDLIKHDIDDNGKIENLAGAFIDNLLKHAFTIVDPKSFEQQLSKTIKDTEKAHPELCAELYRNVFINMMVSYFVATKFGLRSMPLSMCGKGAFQYFALLEIFDDLPEELQDGLLNYFGEQGIWGITEEDLTDEVL